MKRKSATGRNAMSEKYDFCWEHHRFKKDRIRVAKVSCWLALITYEKTGYTIPLSEIDPLFRSFLQQAGREAKGATGGKR